MSMLEEPRARLLIVDDDAAQMQALASTLEIEGYAPAAFTSAAKALDALRESSFELVLTDLTMPQMDGIEFLEAAHRIDPQIIGIVMTGHGSIDTAVAAMRAGALDYILKPFTLAAIRPVLERALTVRRLRVENLQLRQAQEEHTRQLKDANTELEAFSHSVSHDLRAPLRSMHAFARMLADEYGTALDERGRGYIQRVLGSTERMENLVEDMLRLSHVNAMELRRIAVDLSQLAGTIVDDLASREAQRHVETQITAGLRCEADPRLLRIALENLIGNAWKFTRKVARARIEVGAVLHEGVQQYFVRDNGAGFNSEYAKDMFAPFRRLHTANEFPGTGVGLSIVQRVIRRHGGSVWADGAVGRGATFYFTIPEEH
jgi:two-component system sensor histidine kinase/response regulator